MEGQQESESGQRRGEINESPSEECRYNERPMESLQEESASEDTFDHEPINGIERFDEKPVEDVQDSECSTNPKEIEVVEENKEPTPEDCSDKKPGGNVESSQCDEKPKQTQAERENTGFTCEKHDQKLNGKMRDPPSTMHRESEEENNIENEYPNEKWEHGEILMGSVQKSQISEDVNRQQPDQGKQSELGFVWIGVLLISLFAYFMLNFQSNQEPEVEKVLNIFLQNFDKVQKSFPNQEEQLWKRSRIMLQKQVNKTVHSEPSILMFAAAWDAEETMRCLTSRIAGAYALAFSSRIMEIDGTGKRFLNSDEVKLDLDNQLSSGFREGRKSAIIHHFQELPPASTLLFYKYCDHENAAFKDVSLLITVLVDEPNPDLSLDALEETVYNFLIMKFSITNESAEYNVMDADKFSGLWSRVAHAILPVRPEREIEENGCKQE